MSLIIQNIIDPNDSGTVSNGNVGLFAGPGGVFYTKQSTGATFAIGGNKNFTYNSLTFELELTDDNSTVTASLVDIAGGYFNQILSFSQSNNVLSLVDGYSTLTSSLAYYAGGFNTGMTFNTASNVLTITDGNSSISATLSSTGANTNLTFNPLSNILTVADGFGSKTASLAQLSGNIGMSFSGNILSLQDGRGTLTASLTLNNFSQYIDVFSGLVGNSATASEVVLYQKDIPANYFNDQTGFNIKAGLRSNTNNDPKEFSLKVGGPTIYTSTADNATPNDGRHNIQFEFIRGGTSSTATANVTGSAQTTYGSGTSSLYDLNVGVGITAPYSWGSTISVQITASASNVDDIELFTTTIYDIK